MGKIWKLKDECEGKPFSTLNLEMVRISTQSAYDGLKRGILLPEIPSEEDTYKIHPELQREDVDVY